MAYEGNTFTEKELNDMVIDAVAVLIGDYSAIRKRAAILLLKALIPHKVLDSLLEDVELICNEDGIYPTDRRDKRVLKWRREILKRGKCEKCGSIRDLDAHHVEAWAYYPKGRADVENGMCLCHECHTHEHRFDKSYALMRAGGRRKKCHYQ